MDVLISFVACCLFAFLLRKQIKKYAVFFYIGAVVIDVIFLSHMLFALSHDAARLLYPYVFRCLIGFALFTIVMYIGVLSEKSKIRRALMPIRGELSIIAAILVAGHVINYLGSYLAQILSGFTGMSLGMILSFCVSSVLIALLAALTVTSFNYVKNRMNQRTWKRLQKTAYAFYGLTYVHIVLILGPTVTSYGQKAVFSIFVYTVVMVAYLGLRVRRAAIDKKRRTAYREGASDFDVLERKEPIVPEKTGTI